jgi:hypothetical protein
VRPRSLQSAQVKMNVNHKEDEWAFVDMRGKRQLRGQTSTPCTAASYAPKVGNCELRITEKQFTKVLIV